MTRNETAREHVANALQLSELALFEFSAHMSLEEAAGVRQVMQAVHRRLWEALRQLDGEEQ